MQFWPNDRLAQVAEVDPAFCGGVLTGFFLQSKCRAAKEVV